MSNTVTPGPKRSPGSGSPERASAGPASRDDVGHLGGAGRRAHGHEDGAGAQHGEERLDGLDTPPRPATGPGRPGRRRAAPAPRPSAPCAGRARRRPRPSPPPDPSISTGACGPVGPLPLPHLGQGVPGRHGGPDGPAPRTAPAPSPVVTGGHSLTVMTARRIAIVPHTHWDREWYKSYQDFRLEPGRTDRHAAPPARAGRQLPPLHARRADGRRRRLPRGPPRGRGAAAGAGRGRAGSAWGRGTS